MVKVKKDLTGQLFGRLTVICQADDYVDPQGNKSARWLCECACPEHNQIIVTGRNLKNKNTQSCGCLHNEKLSKNNQQLKRKYNTYDLSGEFGIGWTTNTNKEFYFDLEDYDKIKDYAWREKLLNNGKYHELVARCNKSKKDIIMAWLIKGKNYDHINRNPLDNKKENLRKATYSQNSQNRTINSNNTSSIIGVNFETDRNQWRAQLRKDYNIKLDARFDNKDDAIKARLQAEAQYFGEFAPQQHLFAQYNIKCEPKGESDNG